MNFMSENLKDYTEAKAHYSWCNKEEARPLLKSLMPSIMAQDAWSRTLQAKRLGTRKEKMGTIVNSYIDHCYTKTEEALMSQEKPRQPAQNLAQALYRKFGIRSEVVCLSKEQAKDLEGRPEPFGKDGVEPEAEREGRALKVIVTTFEGPDIKHMDTKQEEHPWLDEVVHWTVQKLKARKYEGIRGACIATWVNIRDVVAVVAYAHSKNAAEKACRITDRTLRVLMCPQAMGAVNLEGDSELHMSTWDLNTKIQRIKKTGQAYRVFTISLQIATFARFEPEAGGIAYEQIVRSKADGLKGALMVERVQERGELGDQEIKELNVFPKYAGALLRTTKGREAKKGQDAVEAKWVADMTLEPVHQDVPIMSSSQEVPGWNMRMEDDLEPLREVYIKANLFNAPVRRKNLEEYKREEIEALGPAEYQTLDVLVRKLLGVAERVKATETVGTRNALGRPMAEETSILEALETVRKTVATNLRVRRNRAFNQKCVTQEILAKFSMS